MSTKGKRNAVNLDLVIFRMFFEALMITIVVFIPSFVAVIQLSTEALWRFYLSISAVGGALMFIGAYLIFRMKGWTAWRVFAVGLALVLAPGLATNLALSLESSAPLQRAPTEESPNPPAMPVIRT